MKNDEKRGVSKRTVAILLALVLVIGCAVGGTLAWLTAKTSEVTNTFSPSDINITLTETWNTDSNGDDKNDSWSAKLVPGYSYKKDPVVTVEKDSEKCYLFVKFDQGNAAQYLDYTSNLSVANGWTQGEGTGDGKNGVPTDVWYRVVDANATQNQSWHLLDGDKITVKGDAVTKDNMNTASASTLTYTAYACQYWKDNTTSFDVGTAWRNASKLDTTGTSGTGAGEAQP